MLCRRHYDVNVTTKDARVLESPQGITYTRVRRIKNETVPSRAPDPFGNTVVFKIMRRRRGIESSPGIVVMARA